MKAFHEIRNYDSNFMVWQSAYEDISFLTHWHQEIELIYVRSGKARLRINDEEFVANEGDLVIVNIGDLHYSDSSDFRNVLDFIVFDPGIIGPRAHNIRFAQSHISAQTLEKHNMQTDTLRLFCEVGRELREKGLFYQELITSMLREFIYRIRRFWPVLSDVSASIGSHVKMFDRLQHLLSYIDDHYMDEIPLSLAAGMMGYSEGHFSNIFKKLVGLNFITYVNAVRIDHAIHMLRNNDTKILDTAMTCGFGNIRSFNRTFKKYTGYTPTEFLHLKDEEVYRFSYYNHKPVCREYVQNDSPVVIKNPSK